MVWLFGCLVVISLCFLQLVQTSVNTGVVVWLACCHFVVFLAARADVCEYWCGCLVVLLSFRCVSCSSCRRLREQIGLDYSECWCDRWASFGYFSCHIVMFSCSLCRSL